MGKRGEKQKRTPKIKDAKQSERFKEAARELGADEDIGLSKCPDRDGHAEIRDLSEQNLQWQRHGQTCRHSISARLESRRLETNRPAHKGSPKQRERP